ncbi:hypothetical protein NBM05_04925 [Rothia sp. AR01]|uniref:DUF2273 domain-containing protein n=1 Tax=Rothia santali TaxID=2949643 RepID=A0A9X2H9X9_9MICC|nr:hypothetical protein [Rothia santali]MCP3425376.1 hypothetical protein [Rothia santali]
MSASKWGLVVGLVLGIVAAFGGFVPFVITAFFGAVGLVVGLALEGRLDLRGLFGRASDRR